MRTPIVICATATKSTQCDLKNTSLNAPASPGSGGGVMKKSLAPAARKSRPRTIRATVVAMFMRAPSAGILPRRRKSGRVFDTIRQTFRTGPVAGLAVRGARLPPSKRGERAFLKGRGAYATFLRHRDEGRNHQRRRLSRRGRRDREAVRVQEHRRDVRGCDRRRADRRG